MPNAGRKMWLCGDIFASREVNIVNNILNSSLNLLVNTEIANFAEADSDCRLVKGDALLWNGARVWRDLWDLSGSLDKWIKNGETWVNTTTSSKNSNTLITHVFPLASVDQSYALMSSSNCGKVAVVFTKT